MQATAEQVSWDDRARDADAQLEPPTDERLALRAAAGDQAAFGVLAERYQGRLCRLAVRLMLNASDAEEVVQDALLNAYRGLPSFRADAKFGTWIYQIVINGALAHRRRSRRRPLTTPLDDHLPRLDETAVARSDGRGHAAAADELLARKQVATRIQDALDRLRGDHRAVFVLRDLEGLSTEVVAEIFAIQVPTVRQRLHRARVKLRALLADLVPSA